MSEDERMEELEQILQSYPELKSGFQQNLLVELLYEVQGIFGCIPEEIQVRISEEMQIKPAVISKIIKLYPSLKQAAYRHKIVLCMGHQCSSNRSTEVMDAIRREIGIGKEGVTADGRFYLTVRYCMKRCKSAPNMCIDNDEYSDVNPKKIPAILKKYR